MQVRKWLISGEINYNVCRICSLTLLPPEVLIPTPITLSVNFFQVTVPYQLLKMSLLTQITVSRWLNSQLTTQNKHFNSHIISISKVLNKLMILTYNDRGNHMTTKHQVCGIEGVRQLAVDIGNCK